MNDWWKSACNALAWMILRNFGDWENEWMIWRALEVRERTFVVVGGVVVFWIFLWAGSLAGGF